MILDEIVAHKKTEIAAAEASVSLASVARAASRQSPPADFALALSRPGISVIAEIKRASPSKGLLAPDLDPSGLAREYVQAGAAAISVLTDSRFFKGSLADLDVVVQAVRSETGDERRVPVMRKEFVLSPYQVYEARAHGADSILLIARILEDDALASLLGLARELGMEPLVETHSREEINRAVACGARVIGINNRDLSTFTTDISRTEELRSAVPEGCVVVSESGIHTRDDVDRLRTAGVNALLVGEALVRSGNVRQAIARMVCDGS